MIDLAYRERYVIQRMTRDQWERQANYLRRHKLRINAEYWGNGKWRWTLRAGEKLAVVHRSLDFHDVLQRALRYIYPPHPVPDVAAELEQYFDREYRPHFAGFDLKG